VKEGRWWEKNKPCVVFRGKKSCERWWGREKRKLTPQELKKNSTNTREGGFSAILKRD